MIEVAALFVYPVKGLAGVACDRFDLDAHGPVRDREWMLIDEQGVFVTQRDDSGLALIQPEIDERAGILRLSADAERVEVELDAAGRSERNVRCWRDTVPARDEGDEAAAWLSRRLGRSLRLVRLCPEHPRPVPAAFTSAPATTRFTDAFPLLIASEASLEALNAKLAAPIGMRRFRPNIVLRGTRPHAEDGWKRIRVGGPDGLVLRFGKLCSRCRVTTVDPDTGQIAAGGEPLRTLARYRTLEIPGRDGDSEHGVFFAANYVHERPGVIELGAPVEVLE